jgi:hypothetical protein
VHGLIFASFRDYLHTEHGADVALDVTADEPQYTLSDAYPDEQFLSLFGQACTRTGMPPEQMLFDFGVFTAATTFARLYSVLFKLSPSARDFLLTVETPIHDTVRVSMPDAQPPKLAVTDLGEDGLQILYTSPRRLCVCFAASSRAPAASTTRRSTSRSRSACFAATRRVGSCSRSPDGAVGFSRAADAY